jgi:hypothetical protein
MIGQNEDAEELMRKIEREEEQLLQKEPEKRVYHLCIVNLVIGTLYCSKGQYTLDNSPNPLEILMTCFHSANRKLRVWNISHHQESRTLRQKVVQ